MTNQDTTVAMRRCIGSTRFGIEAHEAPENEFPVQPSQKDGLGRMCHEHWRQYTNALRKVAVARRAEQLAEVVESQAGPDPEPLPAAPACEHTLAAPMVGEGERSRQRRPAGRAGPRGSRTRGPTRRSLSRRTEAPGRMNGGLLLAVGPVARSTLIAPLRGLVVPMGDTPGRVSTVSAGAGRQG